MKNKEALKFWLYLYPSIIGLSILGLFLAPDFLIAPSTIPILGTYNSPRRHSWEAFILIIIVAFLIIPLLNKIVWKSANITSASLTKTTFQNGRLFIGSVTIFVVTLLISEVTYRLTPLLNLQGSLFFHGFWITLAVTASGLFFYLIYISYLLGDNNFFDSKRYLKAKDWMLITLILILIVASTFLWQIKNACEQVKVGFGIYCIQRYFAGDLY